MPCCENAKSSIPAAAAALLAMIALAFGAGVAATSQGFLIQDASASLREGVYYVDADVDLNFSQESTEALENGVALTVQYEMEVRRVRPWLWNPGVARLEARYQLALHALSEQYVVRNLNLGTTQSFPTLAAARGALGQVQHFPLVDANLLDRGTSYRWRMRARLDIAALPAPLRPFAYLSQLWQHDSHWYEWPLSR